MSRSSRTRLLWAAMIAIPVLFVVIAALQVRIDAQMRSAKKEKEELLLGSGGVVKMLSLGYDSLLADIYWTRAVQYYGARLGTPQADFQLLAPLLDISTTLDPKLIISYRFGAIFLSEPAPMGAGRTDLAIDLIKRGITANPEEWHLYADLGFLYYWRLKDYQNASAAYLAGSKTPNGPLWMKLMAARVAEKGGSIETSRMIWLELYESTRNPNIRKKAMEQLHRLMAEEDESHLNDLAEQYHVRFGRFPASTKEMRDAGMLAGIPVDPAGYPYIFGADGRSHVDPRSPVTEPKP
jgi:tetratricopeptide (TPR) repeat protein